jgi:hypothetical protein
MAVKDPKAKRQTISFKGGTVTAARGLIEWVFGKVTLSWDKAGIEAPLGKRRRWKNGIRRRTASAQGESVKIVLDDLDATTYTFRVTGPVLDFVSKVVAEKGDKINEIYTRRGTVYAKTVKVDAA